MSESTQLDSPLEQRRQRRAEVRHVIAVAIPVVVTTSSRAVMDIADYTMISWLRQDEALAAILPAQIVMWSYIIAGLGIVSVVSTFASQCLGREQYRDCSTYGWQSLYLAAVFGVVGLMLRPTLPWLVAACGHEPRVQELELAYARVALLTVGPTIVAYGLGWFFIGIHRPWVTMWTAIEANVVNVIVSFVLIFGHLGFEPMGIAGAAWGTFAAVCYRAARLAITLLMPSMARRFYTWQTWKPSWRCLKGLLRVGLPCSLQWLCDVVVWAIFVNVLVGSRFGTVHLIATNTVWQYMRVAFLPTLGVGQALTALVGKSIGSRNPERAIREVRTAAMITLAYMGSLSLLYWLWGAELVGFFSNDASVIEIGAKIMVFAAVFQLFDAMAIAYNSALRGAGDTFIPSMFFIVSNWVIIVGGGWFMAATYPGLGSLGPWLAASFLIIITGLFLWWRWHSRAWMKIDLFRSRAGRVAATRADATEGDGADGPTEAATTPSTGDSPV
jgi:MATE family multidrug resistance protein